MVYVHKGFIPIEGVRQLFSNVLQVSRNPSSTAAYTPKQNGVSERNGRSIFNISRLLVNKAQLPKYLRCELVASAVFANS